MTRKPNPDDLRHIADGIGANADYDQVAAPIRAKKLRACAAAWEADRMDALRREVAWQSKIELLLQRLEEAGWHDLVTDPPTGSEVVLLYNPITDSLHTWTPAYCLHTWTPAYDTQWVCVKCGCRIAVENSGGTAPDAWEAEQKAQYNEGYEAGALTMSGQYHDEVESLRKRLEEAEIEADKWRRIAGSMNDMDPWIGERCGYPPSESEK